MQETPSIKAWQVLVLGIGAVSLIQILGRSGVGLVNLLANSVNTLLFNNALTVNNGGTLNLNGGSQ